MLSSWIVYLIVGRVLVYLWQQFPLPKRIEKIKTIEYLHRCDLCSGVWLYAFLAAVMNLSLLKVLGFENIPFIGEAITGCVVSFVVHIFILGWKSKFEVIVI